MLTGIKKIQGLGVFGNFIAANDLPAFARYNVIYGENGTGKTTLSRLFAVLGDGSHPDYPDLEYSISFETGQLGKGQKYPRKVRVFNSDYVESNIGQFKGPLRPILIVGQENKILAAEAKVEQEIYDGRTQRIDALSAAVAKLDADKGKVFSAIAKTIGEATSGTVLRSYRKPDAETAFAKIQAFEILAETDLERFRGTVRQEQQEPVPPFDQPTLDLHPDGSPRPLEALIEYVVKGTNALTQRSAQAGVLQRLTEQPSIAKWVEEGLAIHRDHSSKNCEFCDQVLPMERMAQLAEHFGVEDQNLKHEIARMQTIAIGVFNAIVGLTPPAKSAFYAEFREPLEEAVANLEASKEKSIAGMSAITNTLEEKLTRRTSSYSADCDVDCADLLTAIDNVRALVEKQNAKTASFEATRSQARTAIELHYLSTIAVQIMEFDEQIAAKRVEAATLTDGSPALEDPRSLQALFASIEQKKATISTAHAASSLINDLLRTFLGRTDLKFESADDGYRVERRGKPAKRLSEGEKTAIAFIYFLVHLGDQDFEVEEGVVVIDDPISSLDASSIYQAFSFLKNGVLDAKQVFVFTHNFEFLKLILNWLKAHKKAAQYYMIRCEEGQDCRDASLVPLDRLLREHPTEYHYLFKQLYCFKSDGTIATAYPIPNMARKLLETFLEFHLPSGKSVFLKLDEADFDAHKKTAIYKFANDLSHRTGQGFDPALVAESQKNVGYLLEMIKALAPLHYEGLEKLSTL